MLVCCILSFAIESHAGTEIKVNPEWKKVTFRLNKDYVEKCIEQLQLRATIETYTGRPATDPSGPGAVFSACIIKINNFKSSFILGKPIKFAFNMKSLSSVRIDGHMTADTLALQVYTGYSNGGDDGHGSSRQAHSLHLREAFDEMPKEEAEALIAIIK